MLHICVRDASVFANRVSNIPGVNSEKHIMPKMHKMQRYQNSDPAKRIDLQEKVPETVMWFLRQQIRTLRSTEAKGDEQQNRMVPWYSETAATTHLGTWKHEAVCLARGWVGKWESTSWKLARHESETVSQKLEAQKVENLSQKSWRVWIGN